MEEAIRLSKDFTLEELIRSDTAQRLHLYNRPSAEELENGRQLVELVLQPTREQWGRLRVSSGFRCQAVNEKVGGRSYSYHLWRRVQVSPRRFDSRSPSRATDEGQWQRRAAIDFQPLDAHIVVVFDWLRLEAPPEVRAAIDQVVLERGREARHDFDDCIHVSWRDTDARHEAWMGETHNRGPYTRVRFSLDGI